MAAKRKTTSGTKWTESDYKEAGYATVKLRLQPENVRKLERLTKGMGKHPATGKKWTRQQVVDLLIEKAKEL